MKRAYPIKMKKGAKFIIVYIPDFDVNTQGNNMVEAIEMARDAIAMSGLMLEDKKQAIPVPSELEQIELSKDEVLTYVDEDFSEYRRKNELKTVKKNCTLPSWLCYEAEKQNINFSALLQEAIKEKLQIS